MNRQRREALARVLKSTKWNRHVAKNGSREHVRSIGLLTAEGEDVPITWCSSPFCIDNLREAEWLMSKDIDPIDAQPPPLLRELFDAAHELSGRDREEIMREAESLLSQLFHPDLLDGPAEASVACVARALIDAERRGIDRAEEVARAWWHSPDCERPDMAIRKLGEAE